MEEKQIIEMYIADAIQEKPYGFEVGSKRFYLYPITLGKMQFLQSHIKALDMNLDNVMKSPYLVALQKVKDKKDEVLYIVAANTIKNKEELFDTNLLLDRINDLSENCNDEDLATLLVICLTKENKYDSFLKHFGIDKDRERMRRVAEAKKDSDTTYTFGGLSIYGTMIDVACERYHWTFDYVVWGISFINLQMLLADHITTIYLTEEEKKNCHVANRNGNDVDAGDPNNEQAMYAILGIHKKKE